MAKNKAAKPVDKEPRENPKWADLIMQAVMQPGKLHDCYRYFYEYSIGNQCLAMAQCVDRGIPIGPIATYNAWKERGRVVSKGQKAIVLCRPLIIKGTEDGANGEKASPAYVRFIYRPFWFTMWQTEANPEYDGPEWMQPEPPNWSRGRMLGALGIEEVRFTEMNGNAQGYSITEKRHLAINPVAAFPHKTTFHEVGHILLGHSHDGEHCEQETEAELVAYLLTDTLGLDVGGQESSRAYIQHYLGAFVLTEGMAQRVFRVCNQVLQSGYPPVQHRAQQKEDAA